jgi:hypothetical protein
MSKIEREKELVTRVDLQEEALYLMDDGHLQPTGDVRTCRCGREGLLCTDYIWWRPREQGGLVGRIVRSPVCLHVSRNQWYPLQRTSCV